MKNRIHKICVILAAAIVVLAATALALCACDGTRQRRLADECLRIHIRANSNLAEDQTVKLAVRDEITQYLSERLENCRSKQEAMSTIKEESQKLIEIANSTLYLHNFEYKASIEINNEYFPDRNYDGYDFPEGNYDAVIIKLGSGEGDNWWCVAFPPLCFVPGDGEKIVYKSWIKELLDKLF